MMGSYVHLPTQPVESVVIVLFEIEGGHETTVAVAGPVALDMV